VFISDVDTLGWQMRRYVNATERLLSRRKTREGQEKKKEAAKSNKVNVAPSVRKKARHTNDGNGGRGFFVWITTYIRFLGDMGNRDGCEMHPVGDGLRDRG